MLVGQHYQNGYVCEDLEAAISEFQARGLDRQPEIIDVEQEVMTPSGPRSQQLRICMFWLNGLQYELIQTIRDEAKVYANAPSNGASIRFHHIALRVDDWDAFRRSVDQQDLPVAMERDPGPEQVRFAYLDGRKAFGHYLEFTSVPEPIWQYMQNL